MTEERFEELMSVDKKMALSDVQAQQDYFKIFKKQKRLPQEFEAELTLLEGRLK